MSTTNFLRLTFFAGLIALTAGGCGISRAIGGKSSPDEFAIATKAPLVVPPDYALRPPRPGESRPQELSPSERAQQVLLGDVSAAPPTLGEQALLQRAGALTANPNIRNLLNAESGGRGEKDRSFANQLLFWNFLDSGVDDSRAPLRVDNPEEWFADRERRIREAIGEEGEVVISKSKSLNLPGVF